MKFRPRATRQVVPRGGVVEAAQASVIYGVIVYQYDPFEGSTNGRPHAPAGPLPGGTNSRGREKTYQRTIASLRVSDEAAHRE